jgi:hypothetical protein
MQGFYKTGLYDCPGVQGRYQAPLIVVQPAPALPFQMLLQPGDVWQRQQHQCRNWDEQ